MEVRKSYFIFIFFACLITSCRQPFVPEKTVAFSRQEWASANKVRVNIDIADTNSLYNIFVVIRHTTAFKYNNLLLDYALISPSRDTAAAMSLNLLLGDKQHWYGDMLGEIVETRVKVNNQPQRLKAGSNVFTLQQFMPDDVLKDILNAGICVEKVNR